mmetsp:Transcript_36915/g.68021  ORF Transcript_36915/g.68021 Transcript_36915/m.68021 type:complete len:218 (-) Transcript_36915:527-1180(-)
MYWARLANRYPRHSLKHPHLQKALRPFRLFQALLVDQTPLDKVRLRPAMLRLRLLHFALSAMQHLERFRHHPRLRMSSHFHSYSELALPLQQILDIWFQLMYLARLASQHPWNLQKRPHLHRAFPKHRSTSCLLLDQTPLALHLALLASQRPKRVPDHPLPHLSAPHYHLCSWWSQDQTALALPLEMFLTIAAGLLPRLTELALLANQPLQPPPEHS